MNRRFTATLDLQRPAGRTPDRLASYDVCPHCKQELSVYLVSCDGHVIETHRCRAHGDVIPMRSAVVNRAAEWPDWSAA